MRLEKRQKMIKLGKTNINVFSIGLGAMPLSLEGRPDANQASAVIESFIDAGGNFIDTANVYCLNESELGHNESLFEKTLSRLNKNDNVIIATKGGVARNGDKWVANGKPDFLRQSCEKSLKALKTDCIFLYQLHSPDPETPLTDSVGELLKLKQEGKILHIGLSNVTLEQIELSLSITDIMSVQNKCNLFNKNCFNNGVIDCCEKNNITFIAHSPLGGHFQHRQLTKNDSLSKLAKKHDVSPYQIMLAWLLSKNPVILPIPGASKISSIKNSLDSIKIELDEEDMQTLNALS